MTLYRERQRKTLFYRLLSGFVAVNFLLHSAVPGYSQGLPRTVLNLPVPGTMVTPSPAFHPALITGITVYPQNPGQFDFIIDIGDDRLQGEALRRESQKLINYFMAALTVPEEELWVNLSPYEKDRIISSGLSQTEMGRDMLAQDYLLKQLTASLMYPEEEFGREFWKRVYDKAYTQYGTTEIPMDTFNKVWIVPENAVVYVHDRSVFVAESHLKVMLEQDYLALESNAGGTAHGLGSVSKDDLVPVSGMAAKIVREVLLPEIEREVNEGRNFANLRQIYHAMILATWYKKNLKESLLGKIYIDRNKVAGIDIEDKQIKDKIYNQYLEAFKKGVYNYIREDYNPATQQMIPRKYFSGGLDGVSTVIARETVSSPLNWAMRRPHVFVEVKPENIAAPVGSSPISRKSLARPVRPALFEHLLVQVEGFVSQGASVPALEVLRNMIRIQKKKGTKDVEGYINDAKEVYFQGLKEKIRNQKQVNKRTQQILQDMIYLQDELGNRSTREFVEVAKMLVFRAMHNEVRDTPSLEQAKKIHQDMVNLRKTLKIKDRGIDLFIIAANQSLNKKLESYNKISSGQEAGKENAWMEKMFASNEQDYYAVIGLRPDAGLEEIEAAWVKLNEEFQAKKITPEVMELAMDAYVILKDKKADEHNKRPFASSPIFSDEEDPFRAALDKIRTQIDRPSLSFAKNSLLKMAQMQKTMGTRMSREDLDNAIRLYFAAANDQIAGIVLKEGANDDLMQKLIDMVDLQTAMQRNEITSTFVDASKRHVFLAMFYDIQDRLEPGKLNETSLQESEEIFQKMEVLLARVGSDSTIQDYVDNAKKLLASKGSTGQAPSSSPVFWDDNLEDQALFEQALSQMKGQAEEGKLGIALKILLTMIEMQKDIGNKNTEPYLDDAKEAYFTETRDKILSHFFNEGVSEATKKDLLDMIDLQNKIGNRTTKELTDYTMVQVFAEMLNEINQELESKSLNPAQQIYADMVNLRNTIKQSENDIKNDDPQSRIGDDSIRFFLEKGAQAIMQKLLVRLGNENEEDLAQKILLEIMQLQDGLEESKDISALVAEAVEVYKRDFSSVKTSTIKEPAMSAREKDLFFPDYYKILGVSPDAGSADIEKAFENRKKELPMQNRSSKGMEVGQLNLEEAHRTLKDPKLRAEYDKKYKEWQSSSPVASQGADYGGIDLNPQNLELKQQGEDMRFQFTVPENLDPAAIQGIRPVIINVTPVINFPLLLGLSQQNEKTI